MDTNAQLLSVLYETVTNVNGWGTFLQALTATYPGGKGAIAIHDPVLQKGSANLAAGWDPEAIASYNAYYEVCEPYGCRALPKGHMGFATHLDYLGSTNGIC